VGKGIVCNLSGCYDLQAKKNRNGSCFGMRMPENQDASDILRQFKRPGNVTLPRALAKKRGAGFEPAPVDPRKIWKLSQIGVLETVAVPPELARITPDWSVKK
jgi:hypothetical protein